MRRFVCGIQMCQGLKPECGHGKTMQAVCAQSGNAPHRRQPQVDPSPSRRASTGNTGLARVRNHDDGQHHAHGLHCCKELLPVGEWEIGNIIFIMLKSVGVGEYNLRALELADSHARRRGTSKLRLRVLKMQQRTVTGELVTFTASERSHTLLPSLLPSEPPPLTPVTPLRGAAGRGDHSALPLPPRWRQRSLY